MLEMDGMGFGRCISHALIGPFGDVLHPSSPLREPYGAVVAVCLESRAVYVSRDLLLVARNFRSLSQFLPLLSNPSPCHTKLADCSRRHNIRQREVLNVSKVTGRVPSLSSFSFSLSPLSHLPRPTRVETRDECGHFYTTRVGYRTHPLSD